MKRRKLVLTRQTLRHLDDASLGRAAGGRRDTILPCGGRTDGCPPVVSTTITEDDTALCAG
jgi:hypothetical protein